MSDFVTQAGPLRELVESELAKLFTSEGFLTDENVPPGLAEPMRYALLGGGKRLRPVLCLAACQAVCGDPAPALPAALAIEVLHNYTLVHDDLPCMDDDLLRRGRPTVHARYGYAQAVLGAELEVPTLDGKVKLNIPEGTQPGATFTVRGKGIPYVNSSRRGDLVFRVNVEIPRSLSDKQKEQVRAFADNCGESNYGRKSGFFKRIFDKFDKKKNG